MISDDLNAKYEKAMATINTLQIIIKALQNEIREAIDASVASDFKYTDQKSRYETAASAAAGASKQAAIDASVASDFKYLDQKSRYETAASAAADASQLATEEAKVEADSRMEIERGALKQAAIDACVASDFKYLDQKSRYELTATAATTAWNAKIIAGEYAHERSFCSARNFYVLEREGFRKALARYELLAKSALMEREQFRNISANAAHDLKSPLHTLLVGLESMRSSDNEAISPSEENRALLDTLDSACAFMGSAISRTIDISKSSGGVALIPCCSSFHLELLLQNPIKWIKATISNDRMSVILSPLPSGIDAVISDRHWIEENLLCLLSNAVKYSTQGNIRVSVKIENNFVRITVEDSGIGLSAESKLLLFKQYSTVQNMAVGSTGLGLYSLLLRTDAIGGSCGVDDREDKKEGSSFWFTFPYRPETIENENETDSARILESRKVRPLRILIVDDSAAVVKMLSKRLNKIGHSTFLACNGADGLRLMINMKNSLDLVVMDMQMPVMDGIEATKRYRKIEIEDSDRRYLHIICSSADCTGKAEALALAAGVDSFLPKPFTTAALTNKIIETFPPLLI